MMPVDSYLINYGAGVQATYSVAPGCVPALEMWRGSLEGGKGLLWGMIYHN